MLLHQTILYIFQIGTKNNRNIFRWNPNPFSSGSFICLTQNLVENFQFNLKINSRLSPKNLFSTNSFVVKFDNNMTPFIYVIKWWLCIIALSNLSFFVILCCCLVSFVWCVLCTLNRIKFPTDSSVLWCISWGMKSWWNQKKKEIHRVFLVYSHFVNTKWVRRFHGCWENQTIQKWSYPC